MPSFCLVCIYEMLVQRIVEQTDRNSHQREVQVVVATAQMLQQGNAADVQQIGECGYQKKSEKQPVFLVLKNEYAIRLEIEQDADDGGQEIGHDIGMVEFQKMFENVKKQVINEQPKERVQDGREYKPDKLRREYLSNKYLEFLYHLKN